MNQRWFASRLVLTLSAAGPTSALTGFWMIGSLIIVFGSGYAPEIATAADTTYPAALQQCGECHMIFPAKMLPQRSWRALLSSLDNHFGENAIVPEAARSEILDYLVANAADTPNAPPRDRHYISELSADSVPLRITRTPWWNQMHADFDFDGVKRTSVKSASNCLACHPGGVN